MPRRTDISSILIIGAGPIVIGQAAEFDYSGTPGGQGAEGGGLSGHRRQFEPGDDHDRSRAGRRDLYRADHARVSSPRSSRRSGPTRCCRRWAGRPRSTPRWRSYKDGTLEKYGVKLIGADAEAIEKAEDRLKFREAMDRIGLESAALGDRAQSRRRAGGARTTSACRRSSGRASRWAGPAAASPTIARNSSRSSRGGLEASPDHRGADRGIGARLEGI